MGGKKTADWKKIFCVGTKVHNVFKWISKSVLRYLYTDLFTHVCAILFSYLWQSLRYLDTLDFFGRTSYFTKSFQSYQIRGIGCRHRFSVVNFGSFRFLFFPESLSSHIIIDNLLSSFVMVLLKKCAFIAFEQRSVYSFKSWGTQTS